ncbi:DUF262 domain-containing protein [Streptomyces phaeochromogenes]
MGEALAELRSGRLRLAADPGGAAEWPKRRKHLLLDSVLRGWPIGSLHVVQGADGVRTVMDGQRRLATLQEFIDGRLDLDGRITPHDQGLRESDGRLYPNLPSGLRAAIDDYPLVVLEIEGMPAAELRSALLRLNDDTGLSEAGRKLVESGSFGAQVRELVLNAVDWGLTEERVSFSNVGLAYDDVISRALVAVEAGSVRNAAADSKELADRLQSGHPVSPETRTEVAEALKELLSLPALDLPPVRFVKATLLSWLLIMIHARRSLGPGSEHHLGHLLEWFEPQRLRLAARLKLDTRPPLRSGMRDLPYEALLARFNEASAVTAHGPDATSLRDAILWLFLVAIGGAPSRRVEPVPAVMRMYEALTQPDAAIEDDDLDELLWAHGGLGSWGEWR